MILLPSGIVRSRRRRAAAAFACGCLCLPAWPAGAARTEVRSYKSLEDFVPGEMDHVSVSPQGRLQLSRGYARLAELDEPVAWAAAAIPAAVLVGTGHDGKVLSIPAGGGPVAVVLDTDELEVYALAAAGDGTVYAGTSPDGKVYRVSPGGTSTVLFDPEERYIWALVLAPDGGLLVATGDKGAVYRVAPDGTATAWLAVEETHVLSLALAPDGTLYAGSGGSGYVYRRGADGRVTVALDTDGSEVKALVLAGGDLFVASTGLPMAGPEIAVAPGVGGATVTVPPPAEEGGEGPLEGFDADGGASRQQPLPVQQPQPAPQAAAAPVAAVLPGAYPAGGSLTSWLYRIAADGLPVEIWESSSETVHSLARLADWMVLGTGNEGKVLAVDPLTGRASILLDFPGAQVTALVPQGDGLAAVTSNLATVWAVEGRAAPSGTYTSPVIDAGHFATWGHLTVRSRGEVRAQSRSGNTEKPGAPWSDWQPSSGPIPSPKGRYLQYRLTLASGPEPPEVRWVEVAYLPHNVAPRLRAVIVLDPHLELVSTRVPGAAARPAARRESQEPPAAPSEPREQEAHGMRSLRWEVEDDNGDDLAFWVYYRGEGESEWKLLGEDLEEPYFSFDSTALPDGAYVLKVETSDERSNPDERALTAELESEPFDIDNTPPVVEVGAIGGRAGEVRSAVRVTDRTSVVDWAESSLDGGPWQPLLPEDLVFDENEERLTVRIEADPEAVEHTLVVRAGDAAGNVGSGKAVRRAGEKR